MKLIILALVFSSIFLTACSGKYDSFATCLTEKGAVMYGTDWCSHCKAQKELFGRSFRNIIYVNCDKAPDQCDAAGVEGFPTWVIGNQSSSGTQPLDKLAVMTGCQLA
ncbi:MAG: thioredoxin domain-containing protein [Candidatus Woesearchaeota archaeon]|nr:thioredoxin domain-containing protein [Candidatus Woesearchaeota archaeon]